MCLQGSPGPSGAAGPIGSAGVRVSSDRLVLMATMFSEFFKHEQHRSSFSVFILYFQGPQGKEGPAGPRGPAGPMVSVLIVCWGFELALVFRENMTHLFKRQMVLIEL